MKIAFKLMYVNIDISICVCIYIIFGYIYIHIQLEYPHFIPMCSKCYHTSGPISGLCEGITSRIWPCMVWHSMAYFRILTFLLRNVI